MAFYHQKYFIRSVKFLILILVYAYLIGHFKQSAISFSSVSFSPNAVVLITVSVLLMLVNWGFEAKKWQCLTQPIEPISWKTAMKGTLIGLASSVITPNRVGDYVGRMWVLSKSNYAQGIASTVLSSMVQTTVTLAMGIGALALYLREANLLYGRAYLLVGGVLLVGLILFIFIVPKWISHRTGKFAEALAFLQDLSKRVLFKSFGLGILRYGLFILQLWLLFSALGTTLPFTAVFTGMGLVYGVSMFIPGIFFSEPAIRGSLGLHFFALFTTNETVVLTAIFLLWMINVALPVVAGTVLLRKLELRK